MIRRLSPLLVGAAIVVVFAILFVALDGAVPLIRLGAPAVFGLLAGGGVHLALGRTPAQIRDDAYDDDARGKVQECLDLVRQVEKAGKGVRSPHMRDDVSRVANVVPELLRRVQATAPTSAYSSASQLQGHLSSLLGVVTTFTDVERNPSFYTDPQAMLTQGEDAARRFLHFALDSIRLVNSGDIASYNANLATVAPPTMPTLGPAGDNA